MNQSYTLAFTCSVCGPSQERLIGGNKELLARLAENHADDIKRFPLRSYRYCSRRLLHDETSEKALMEFLNHLGRHRGR